MTILTDALENKWSLAFEESSEPVIETEAFLKSALSLARDLENYDAMEEFDEEFVALCNHCKTDTLVGHI